MLFRFVCLVMLVCPAMALAQATPHEATAASRADAWVAFERARDQRAQRAERVTYPLLLGLAAATGTTLSLLDGESVSGRTRGLFAASGALAAGAMVPTIALRDRNARRRWFGLGSTAFSLGFGAALISVGHDEQEADREDGVVPRWAGIAAIVQGLALLPMALIPGLPEARDYEAHAALPAEARLESAARLLAKIDRYEQRLVGIAVIANVLAAGALGIGAIQAGARDDRRALGFIALAPIASALLGLPRLFVRPRLERLMHGEAPDRLPLNPW